MTDRKYTPNVVEGGASGHDSPQTDNGPAAPTIIEMTSTKNTIVEDGVVPTMTARMGTGGNQVHAVCVEAQGFPLGFRPENVRVYDETATTVCNGTRPGFTCGVIKTETPEQISAVCCGTDDENIAATLDASYYKGAGSRNGKERTVVAVDCRNGTENGTENGTLQAKSNGGTSYNCNNVCRTEGGDGQSVVRRLTPL